MINDPNLTGDNGEPKYWIVPNNKELQPRGLFTSTHRTPDGDLIPVVPVDQYHPERNPNPEVSEIVRQFDQLDPKRWHKLMSERQLSELYSNVGLSTTQIQRLLSERKDQKERVKWAHKECDELVVIHRRFLQPSTFISFAKDDTSEHGIYTYSEFSVIDLLSIVPDTIEKVELVSEFETTGGIPVTRYDVFQRISNLAMKKVVTQTREESAAWYPPQEFWPQISSSQE